LYSTAFRRLGGVTQVAASGEIALFHTRLTHSLKTAQVATRIAHHLTTGPWQAPRWRKMVDEYGGMEARVIRPACLAHDLGHPPFGHTAESELQRITSQWQNRARPKRPGAGDRVALTPLIADGHDLRDRFSGNAQSFRIVTKLASREPPDHPGDCPALNLTRGTLAALLKYPWARDKLPSGVHTDKHNKWGFYDSESEIARWIFAEEGVPPGRKVDVRDRTWEYRLIEAQVMDWADDISYAVHDVEDFFRAGLIPLDHLAVNPSEWEDFFNYAWNRKLRQLYTDSEREQVKTWGEERIFKIFPQTPYVGSAQDRINLHKFASTLIQDVTDGTRLAENGAVVADDEYLAVIELLKQLTWYYVLDRPSLESVQRGQRRLIRSLYSNLIEWVTEAWDGPGELPAGRRHELPARLLEFLDIAFLYDPPPTDPEGTGDSGNKRISRAVIDYIVSLTEGQVMALNSRLSGQSHGSMLDNWLIL
jgi:dGTPase